MHKTLFLFFILLMGVLQSGTTQISDPIPDKIQHSGISVELESYLTMQPTSSVQPRARINMLRALPDDSKRMATIDLRGLLWITTNESSSLFLKIQDHFPDFILQPGKGTGFGAFDFHPDFATNGKFYSAHSQKTNSLPADFKSLATSTIAMQWVVTEWTAEDPSASVFKGSFRILFVADFPSEIHGIQDIQFNPTAAIGEKDYGMLYVCIGEGGSSLHYLAENIQNKGSHLGTIFRIDPFGNNSKNGAYGIPEDNPFVNENDALGEIFAYGFRNPHRISWDTAGENLMFIGDIGEKNIEEINIGIKGGNYGWDKREGTFEYKRDIGREFVYPLPDNDESFEFRYPIAQYDHDEGIAVVGGYVYRGLNVPELYGHYIFGDIASGRLFHFPVEAIQNEPKPIEIKELYLHDEHGSRTTLKILGQTDRPDLRFGLDKSGEIYFLTKADGKVSRFKSGLPSSIDKDSAFGKGYLITPNPNIGIFSVTLPQWTADVPYLIRDITGHEIKKSILSENNRTVNISNAPGGIYFLQLWQNGEQKSLKFIKH